MVRKTEAPLQLPFLHGDAYLTRMRSIQHRIQRNMGAASSVAQAPLGAATKARKSDSLVALVSIPCCLTL